MSLETQFKSILGREQGLIPFLRKLDKTQKKTLAPVIKKMAKDHSRFDGTLRLSDAQRRMLGIAGFVCCDKKTAFSTDLVWIISWIVEKETLDHVLPWFCPHWFDALVNRMTEWRFRLTYDWVMELTEKGFLKPEDQLIVQLMPSMIFERKKETKQNEYLINFESLTKRAITLEQHIWFLFRFETQINWSGRYLNISGKEENHWFSLFKKFVEEGKIDRQRVLSSALEAASGNFNKNLTNWFIDLLTYMEPNAAEVIAMQHNVVALFTSAHSKPVNTALKYLKTVANHPEFDVAGLLDQAFILLSSETKSVVNSTLILFSKLARKHTESLPEMIQATCQAFMHQDERIQVRAAKFVQRYGNPEDEEIRLSLTSYYDGMLSEPKELLADFVGDMDEVVEGEALPEPDALPPIISEENRVPQIQTMDDLIFLTSQAFDNHEPWHFDMLPAALIRMQDEITGEHMVQFEPAFQRAYKLIMGDLRSHQGVLDNLLATFFVEFGEVLSKRFPDQTRSIQVIRRGYRDSTDTWRGDGYRRRLRAGLTGWSSSDYFRPFRPLKSLLIHALHCLKTSQTLPLLSTPTHAPYWIDPVVLVDRLIIYQKAGKQPEPVDLKLALARTALEAPEKALEKASRSLYGDLKSEVVDLLGRKTDHPEIFPWQVQSKTRQEQIFDYRLNKAVKKPVKTTTVLIGHPKARNGESQPNGFFDSVKKALFGTQPHRRAYFYNDMGISAYPGGHFSQNDVARIFSMVPNRPEILFAQTIRRCLNKSEFWGVDSKRFVIALLECMLDQRAEYMEMAHLLIATAMLSNDKTARQLSAEVWIKGVGEDRFNNELLGKDIGKLAAEEYGPLKRFTDLIPQFMANISSRHNRALEKLLTVAIPQMPAIPIKNTRKLLEIYREVLATNKTSNIDPHVAAKLEQWKPVNSLKKIVSSICG